MLIRIPWTRSKNSYLKEALSCLLVLDAAHYRFQFCAGPGQTVKSVFELQLFELL